jgi:hypothetical protein
MTPTMMPGIRNNCTKNAALGGSTGGKASFGEIGFRSGLESDMVAARKR